MSSSNGGLSSATNGRSGSTGSANINLNLKGQERSIAAGPGAGASGATTTSITHKTLPDLKTQRSNSACHAHESLSALRRIVLPEKPPEKPLSYAAAQSRVLGKEAKEGHLVYCEGRLHSGPLQSLIVHMVPTHEYYPDDGFVFAFLLSARLFVRPHELLAQISQTWEQQDVGAGGDAVDDAGQVPGRPMLLSINSASPLTQRKGSATAVSASSSELEPRPQQRTSTQRSAQYCIRLLSEWIEIFPYDFRDERLMQQVRILARKCVYIDNSLGKQVSRILQLLVSRLTSLEQYEEFLQTLTSEEASNQQQQHHHHGHHHHLHNAFQTFLGTSSHTNGASGGGSASGASNSSSSGHTSSASTSNSISTTPQPDEVFGIMDMCPSCADLAHQLTAIELERLSHIGPEEFVQAFTKDYQQQAKDGGKESSKGKGSGGGSLNDMKKTRNLESYVQWFNRLSYLTASEIVKYPKKKQRVRIIEYWIETARECFNIGNFNSLMAIIAGLNLAPIGRLKKTWAKVQSAKFSVLEHQMDPTSNFNSYRSTLKAAMWRSEGATEERERIIIPFFSLFVKDLYFLNEGCSNRRLPNNHINFEKCSQLAKQVMEFNEWKKVNCPFEKLPNVIAYLQHSAVLNENTLSLASFECEPPENTEEKDRYKTVKAETKQQLLQQLQEQQQ
ncbi:ras-GEF domain-containing family member 1B isoform X1 [Drosophila rhopaloa]|uniref:Ras-GEF domain-containing family member 1B n=1 Tax=Drosophila rhopaloa TaxID=1041015 RepID=A0ABM5J620_DRORH|nr:ras-GEF domain-containing family member 1B isoform X1 [Drosophila rhopaloa]XP_044314269.1 ras-GEF domain-containing family member 1B isoform X1 [Drosophila rhopaloa]